MKDAADAVPNGSVLLGHDCHPHAQPRRRGDRGLGGVSANDAEYRDDARPDTAG